jgi:hypothetical protein
MVAEVISNHLDGGYIIWGMVRIERGISLCRRISFMVSSTNGSKNRYWPVRQSVSQSVRLFLVFTLCLSLITIPCAWPWQVSYLDLSALWYTLLFLTFNYFRFGKYPIGWCGISILFLDSCKAAFPYTVPSTDASLLSTDGSKYRRLSSHGSKYRWF